LCWGHRVSLREEQRPGQQPPVPAQPFPGQRGMKAAPAAPPHSPKTCTALLSTVCTHFARHCQLLSHCLKMPLVHSFPPCHPLPDLSQHLSSLLPLPNSGSCYSSCLPYCPHAACSSPFKTPQHTNKLKIT